MASATALLKIVQLVFEREHPIATQAEQKLDARHAGQVGGAARREPTELVQLDGRQHQHLAREACFVGLLGGRT